MNALEYPTAKIPLITIGGKLMGLRTVVGAVLSFVSMSVVPQSGYEQ